MTGLSSIQLYIHRSQVFLLLLVGLTLSCTVQKRHYRKGFYVNETAKTNVCRDAVSAKTTKDFSRATDAEDQGVTAPELMASGATALTPAIFPAKKPAISLGDTCDVIFFRNGQEISARVLEITEQEVSYRKCEMSDGPLFVSLRNDIFMIRYANGTKQVFDQTPAAGTASQGTTGSGPIDHPKMSLLSILTALGLFFPPVAVASLILSKRMQKEFDARPGVFRSRSMVQACVLVSLIVLLVFFSYIFVVFGILFLF